MRVSTYESNAMFGRFHEVITFTRKFRALCAVTCLR